MGLLCSLSFLGKAVLHTVQPGIKCTLTALCINLLMQASLFASPL